MLINDVNVKGVVNANRSFREPARVDSRRVYAARYRCQRKLPERREKMADSERNN